MNNLTQFFFSLCVLLLFIVCYDLCIVFTYVYRDASTWPIIVWPDQLRAYSAHSMNNRYKYNSVVCKSCAPPAKMSDAYRNAHTHKIPDASVGLKWFTAPWRTLRQFFRASNNGCSSACAFILTLNSVPYISPSNSIWCWIRSDLYFLG